MSALNDERVDLAGKLAAAGLPVTLDPRAPAPIVLMDAPPRGGESFGIGGWSVTYPIQVLAPPPGGADTLVWQLDQVELILRTLGDADWYPGTYDPSGKALPAYTLEYRRDVTNPDC